jgi:hypothetical protein
MASSMYCCCRENGISPQNAKNVLGNVNPHTRRLPYPREIVEIDNIQNLIIPSKYRE